MTQVDPTTAAVVRHLTPTARARLDRYIREASGNQRVSRTGFRATASEMPGLEGVRDVTARMRRGNAVLTVRFGDSAAWEGQGAMLWVKAPDTVIAAMRGRALTDIVSHPMLEGVRVSSARQADGHIRVESRRRPCVPLADVASTGVERPLDIIDTLRALGVGQVCRGAANVITRLSGPARQTLLGRLCEQGCAGVMDLFGWPPGGIEGMSLKVSDGKLQASAQLVSGRFVTGRLSLHGCTSASRSLAFSSGLFWSYKTMAGAGNFARAPRQPLITLEAFAAEIDREAGGVRIAA